MSKGTSEWSFIGHVTKWLTRPNFSEPKHPTQWPSEATAIVKTPQGAEKVVGACRRSAFFRLLTSWYDYTDHYKHWKTLVQQLESEKIPPPEYMLWIWEQGKLYEEFLIQAAKASGVFIDEQVRIYLPYCNLSGSIDIVVIDPTTGLYRIVEAKSVYGHGADSVLGSQYQRSKGSMGEPKTSNLIQVALYYWHKAKDDPRFDYALLTYGSRDNGRYGEFEVRTVEEEGLDWIEYRAYHPYPGAWIRTPINIQSVISCYKSVQQNIDLGTIPERDYSIEFTDAELNEMIKLGLLSDADEEKFVKYRRRIAYNKWVETTSELDDIDLLSQANDWRDEIGAALCKRLDTYIDDSDRKRETTIKNLRKLVAKKPYKKPEKGDWQCRYCKWKNTCYDQDNQPREVSI